MDKRKINSFILNICKGVKMVNYKQYYRYWDNIDGNILRFYKALIFFANAYQL